MARAAQRTDDRNNDGRALVVQPPRLPYPAAEAAPAGVDPGQWKALVDAIFPSAKTVDGVMLAVTYCKARGLDIFKRPVHVVPMWNAALGREVETVWPGINDHRTTASRTRQWAGNDECVFGPTLHEGFHEKQQRTKRNGNDREKYVAEGSCEAFDFPEWAQVTVYRMIEGQRVPFVGPKVLFKEIFAGMKGLRVPNDKWQSSPFQMLEKCAEAAALRRAFPEELGNDYTAEEMEGKVFRGDPIAAAKEHFEGDPELKAEPKPTRESVKATAELWTEKGIPKPCWEMLENMSETMNSPTATVAGLERGKEDYVDRLAQDALWNDAALDELERRFDEAIAKKSGATEGTNNEQTTD